MALKTKKFELKDSEQKTIKLEVSTFAGSFGVILFSKIFLLITPILKPILKNVNLKSIDLMDMDIDFGEVAEVIITKMDEDKILSLIKDIVSCTRLGEYDLCVTDAFDIAFAGEYGLLIQTIKHVLETNYSSFFVGNAIKNLIAKSQKIVRK